MARPPLPLGSHGAVATTQLGPRRFVARTRRRDEDGITRKVEASGTSAAQASRHLMAALAQRRAQSTDEITASTRLAVVVERWLDDVERSDRSTGTRRLYRQTADLHVVPRIGALLVREATVPRLDAYVRALGEEVGPSTSKLARTVVLGALGLAVRHGALPYNTMREVTPVRQQRHEVRAPGLDDVRALRADLAADERAVSVDLHHVVDLMLGTGARIGEALALRWADVDLDVGTVALTGTVVRVVDRAAGTSTVVRQDTTKGHRPRALLVPAFTLAALFAQRHRRLPGGEHALVFPSVVGGLREVTTVERQWRGFRERYPRWSTLTTHAFRRAVATAVEREAGMAVAAAVLGHSSERITAAHYVERATLGPDVTGVLGRFGEVPAGFPVDEPVDRLPTAG